MAKKFYIYSTLACDNHYQNHKASGNDMPLPDGEGVRIKGGAGVANDRLITPRGVVTTVTEQQLEYLEANAVFQMHKKNGFIEVSSENIDPDKAAADMTGRDNSAPIVPQDLKPAEQPAAVGGEAQQIAEDEAETGVAPRGARRGNRS